MMQYCHVIKFLRWISRFLKLPSEFTEVTEGRVFVILDFDYLYLQNSCNLLGLLGWLDTYLVWWSALKSGIGLWYVNSNIYFFHCLWTLLYCVSLSYIWLRCSENANKVISFYTPASLIVTLSKFLRHFLKSRCIIIVMIMCLGYKNMHPLMIPAICSQH